MNIFIVYARLYGDCLKKTGKSLAQLWWASLLPIVLLIAALVGFLLLVTALGQLIGGIAGTLWMTALMSCYLYFLDGSVSFTKVNPRELGKSFGAYFWSVSNVLFVFWIAQIVLGPMLGRTPQGQTLVSVIFAVAGIACNAAPEVIYEKGSYGGLATLAASVRFLQDNLLEWGLPNVIVGAGLYFLGRLLFLPTLLGQLLGLLAASTALHIFMLFRGHLFGALDGTSHRQRMYKFRNAA